MALAAARNLVGAGHRVGAQAAPARVWQEPQDGAVMAGVGTTADGGGADWEVVAGASAGEGPCTGCPIMWIASNRP